MNSSFIICSFVIFNLCFISVANAHCKNTTEGARAELPDDAFLVDLRKMPNIARDDFNIFIADQKTLPALGLSDTQFRILYNNLKSGATFPTHYHPRGAETLTIVGGVARISFSLENGRNISNVVSYLQTVVVPLGLIHTTTCIGEKICRIISVFNNAEPGTIFI